MVKVFLACALVSISPAIGQEFWKGTKEGMSIADVKLHVGDGEEPKATATLDSGATEKWRIPRIDISGVQVTVSFFFLNDRLDMVRVSRIEGTDPSGRSAFKRFQEVLSMKYGSPISEDSSSISETVIWKNGRTAIRLSHTAVGDVDSVLVLYSADLARAGDLL